jgi:N-methylhydantoinase A
MSLVSQSYLRTAFEDEYAKRYGHCSQNVPIDIVNLRVVVTGVADKPVMKELQAGNATVEPETRHVNFDGKSFVPCTIWQRDTLSAGVHISGPAIIEESASTTVVCPNDWATVDHLGNIRITVGDDQ